MPSQLFTGRARLIVWIGFWIAAFAATHTPPPERSAPPPINDKLMHFAGFATLGLLTLWAVSAGSRPPTGRRVLLWWLILVAYALLDEVTQPLVRRSFEIADIIADACGAAAGIGLALWLQRVTASQAPPE